VSSCCGVTVKFGLFTVKFTLPPLIGYPKSVRYAVIRTLCPSNGEEEFADSVNEAFGATYVVACACMFPAYTSFGADAHELLIDRPQSFAVMYIGEDTYWPRFAFLGMLNTHMDDAPGGTYVGEHGPV
jgi:hypothetical protein